MPKPSLQTTITIPLELFAIVSRASAWQAFNPRSVNKCANWRCIDIVLLAAQCMKVPTGHMVSMILVTAEDGCIPTVAHPEMNMSLALVVTNEKSEYELSSGEFKFRESPLPCDAK